MLSHTSNAEKWVHRFPFRLDFTCEVRRPRIPPRRPATAIPGAFCGATPATTPPTITINGDNPAIIHLGDTYGDLGATVSDTGSGQAGDTNLDFKTFLNGTLVSNIAIDTSQVATDTIDYVVTDTDGLTATSTRTVIIEASPSIVPTDDASTTAATSTAQ
jgi:hypothetical protein